MESMHTVAFNKPYYLALDVFFTVVEKFGHCWGLSPVFKLLENGV